MPKINIDHQHVDLGDLTDMSAGVANMKYELARLRSSALHSTKHVPLSQWIEDTVVLSSDSAVQGAMKLFGYQKGMADAITDQSIERITVKKSARVGYTRIVTCALGYFVAVDPSPSMIVQPSLEDADEYSGGEVAEFFRNTPCLSAEIGRRRSRDRMQKRRARLFRNGAIQYFVGAESPKGFRRKTVKFLALDEISGYPSSSGNEGDPYLLAVKRTLTYHDRKILVGSSPTIQGQSRIDDLFEQSDKRFYHVPCPHCSAQDGKPAGFQVLKWGGKDKPYGIKWSRREDGAIERAWYECEHCHEAIEEHNKPWMIENGRWVASKPTRRHAGFHVWAGYSQFDNAAWPILAAEYIDACRRPELLQTFYNTVLGECWTENQRGSTTVDDLVAARRTYPSELPDQAVLVTCGVDTQESRLEATWTAWDEYENGYVVDIRVFMGDPNGPEPWAELDKVLLERWHRRDGVELPTAACCIDSGGSRTDAVYRFCAERAGRKVMAIRGRNESDEKRYPVWLGVPTFKTKGSKPLYEVGTQSAKWTLMGMLRPESDQATGPRLYLPAHYDRERIEQLLAEEQVRKHKGHRSWLMWENVHNKRNEALDTLVYSFAALRAVQQTGVSLAKQAQIYGFAGVKKAPEPIPQSDALEIRPAPVKLESTTRQTMPAPLRQPPRPRAPGFVGVARGSWK